MVIAVPGSLNSLLEVPWTDKLGGGFEYRWAEGRGT